ncbi:NAD(P)/FAD-dependent oxidoreductase [Herbaspirillum rubrisubalbicans]|uniref:FAD-dependent oxidoreductase n=1 Tax=Herbaspirillum rubrisubalbicans TaxID=80842 RepID=UPI00209C94C6|nr:NAD(P)/FAD-dependent oxidoreductase [Herbaspirillum rubrisubalbicans]MCP1573438.1 2-polyprenyl-6-methoxyphenol hydroxylase-like FAD-dependent oxidoreductase [Herbaspirillum rubrisubalbicans]
MKPLHIAIAGAGPAGLAMALYLKRAGHRVSLLERFVQAAPVGSGLILQPTGLTVLQDLGLFSRIAALGQRIDRLYGADARSGKTVLDVRYDAIAGGRYGIAVHRAALFGVLLEAARQEGIEVETGHDISGLEHTGAQAWLTAADGRRLGGFDLVIDASGARSPLRRHALRSCEPRPLPYGAFWVSLRAQPGLSFGHNSLVQRYRRASTMIGVLPIGRPRPQDEPMVAFFWSTRPDRVESLKQAGLSAWKDGVHALWPECAPYLAQIDGFEQMTLARYGHHTLPLPYAERLAIIGDAAHSTSPQLGQGANMALLDARALSHALQQSDTLEQALPRYAASRRRHVRTFQAMSAMFTPFYQSDSLWLPWVRDQLAARLSVVPPAPQLLARMVAGTLVDPFTSIGLREHDWTAAPQPSALTEGIQAQRE